METSLIEKLASVFTAVGTVAVAVAAIWGDWIRSKFLGPKLELSLVDRWDINTTNQGEAMQVRVVGLAQNAVSKPLLLEIAWDGTWSTDLEEMQRHFVVKEVSG